MKKIFPIFLYVLFVSFNVNAVELESINESNNKNELKEAFVLLYASNENWNKFLSEVKSGDKSSVLMAIEFSELSDAGISEELSYVISYAYSINPSAFPEYMSHNDVCHLSLEWGTKQEVSTYIDRMYKILENADTNEYFRSGCKEKIDQLAEFVKTWDGAPP